MSGNNGKWIESIDLMEAYAYGTSKLCKKEKIKCKNIMKQYKND